MGYTFNKIHNISFAAFLLITNNNKYACKYKSVQKSATSINKQDN